jgi:uncharacterized cofD-like protein
VVALGGGHGLAASLEALKLVCDDITAVVTVADDGGSSGRLRAELGVLPPGDLRMALCALAGSTDTEAVWQQVVQHRFAGAGALAGHAVGNLVLAALFEVTGDLVTSLGLLGEVLGVTGRVLPMATEPLEIVAEVAGLVADDPSAVHLVRGQVAVATTPGRVVTVRLVPERPRACQEAVDAVRDAEWVVMGPGSWFTSVLPHLLVPDLAEAVTKTAARRMLALNLAPQPGETEGFSPEAHIEVLCAHAPDIDVDVVLADRSSVPDAAAERRLREVARSMSAELVVAPVRAADGSPHHDADQLARVYGRIFTDTGDDRWR